MKLAIHTFLASSLFVLPTTAWGTNAPQFIGKDLFTLLGATLGDIGSSSGGNPIGNGQVVGSSGFGAEARLWASPLGNAVNLHSPNTLNFVYSVATGTDGKQQVGYAYLPARHAILWNSTAESAIDLHPRHLTYLSGSYAIGVFGDQQVGAGIGRDGSTVRALLWNGSAQSAIDLNPTNLTGIENNVAVATDGVQQVGFVNRLIGPAIWQGHAIVWSGSANSAVDLHPTQLPNFQGSHATGVGGGQQVGSGVVDVDNSSEFHALMWSGTAASTVDLHPNHIPNLYSSSAQDTDGLHQVGFIEVKPTFNYKAVLWSGTPDSMIDLHALLPAGMKDSLAYSIDEGKIYGIATDPTGAVHAVMWVPVPEPATATLALVLAISAAGIRRRAWESNASNS